MDFQEILKTVEYIDGSVYYGEVKDNNIRHGKGKFSFGNGLYYEGEFNNDLYHGVGTLLMDNLLIFKGEFINGKKSGRGTLISTDKMFKYEGQWKNNMKNGLGEQ